MDNKVIYGKIIGGKLYRFPGYIYEGEYVTYNPKEEAIFKHGFKKVLFLDDIPDSSQYDYRFIWRETDFEIIQEVQLKEIKTDPGSRFHRFFGSKQGQYKQVREALQEVHNHRKYIKEEIFKKHYLSSLLYDYLIAQHPDKSIDEQIKQLHPGDKVGTMLTSDGEEIQSIPTIAAVIEERHMTVLSSFSQIVAPLMHLQWDAAEYEHFHYRMIFCYLHTLFDDFLSKTIRLIITLFPAGADYNTTLSLSNLFEINDIVELREKTIDKKIDSFGHGNYQKKIEFIIRHGIIPQIPQEEYKDDMILFCEIRNILVHNEGVVNRVFLEKIKDTKYAEQYTLGEDIIITYDAVSQALSMVEKLCADLYERIKEKFPI